MTILSSKVIELLIRLLALRIPAGPEIDKSMSILIEVEVIIESLKGSKAA
jgi:hypothetical protein